MQKYTPTQIDFDLINQIKWSYNQWYTRIVQLDVNKTKALISYCYIELDWYSVELKSKSNHQRNIVW